jgi:peptide/nickel transport system ATP-binding protein/oligopeptide transport system ATP-binding protein
MPQILEIKDLKTHFHMHDHLIRAVDGVGLKLDQGETLGIVGESGCGKSVMSLSVMKLVPMPPGKIESGEILLQGEDLLAASEEKMRQIRGNSIAMIFQEPMTSLNPLYTIGYQISEPLKLHRGMEKQEALDECARLLALVGIPDPKERVHEYPFQLSGGLRQRAMIAMALACEPEVLIADEPTTALDVTIQAQILRLMRDLKERTNTAIMFITHDLAVIASFADRVMVMYAGVQVEMAPVRVLFKNPLHPYTDGLLGSIPKVGQHKTMADGSRDSLTVIKGTLPDPKNFPSGCRFAPRCPKVMDKCWEQEPQVLEVEDNHRVRCYLYGD